MTKYPTRYLRCLNFRADQFTLALVALGLLGTVLILFRQFSYGPILDSDSVSYIVGARLLSEGEFVLSADFGPLYPILLSAAGLFVFDPRDVVGPLNAAAFGLTIFVVGWWLRRHVESRFLVVFAALAIAFSPSLTWNASGGWPEQVFILFVTLSLFLADRYLGDGRSSSLVWLGVFTALACLTRYIGVAVVAAVVLLLLFRPGAALRDRMKDCVVYAGVSSVPVCLWMLRNFLTVGEPTGVDRFGAVFSPPLGVLEAVLPRIQGAIFLGFLTEEFQTMATTLTAVYLVGLGIAVGVGLIRSQANSWSSWRPFYVVGVFSLTFIALLVLALVIGGSVYANSRLPAYPLPAYIPLLLSAVFALDRFLVYRWKRNLPGTSGGAGMTRARRRQGHGRRRRTHVREGGYNLLTVILVTMLSLWLSYNVVTSVRHAVLANAYYAEVYNLGYASSKFVRSDVIHYITEAPVDGLVVSNASYALRVNTDLPELADLPKSLDETREWVANAEDGTWIVWFYDHWNNYIFDYRAGDLQGMEGLEPIADLSEGVIFRIAEGAK